MVGKSEVADAKNIAGLKQLLEPQENQSLRSFGIMELGEESCQIFGFKGVIRTIFRNKDLSLVRDALVVGDCRALLGWTEEGVGP